MPEEKQEVSEQTKPTSSQEEKKKDSDLCALLQQLNRM